MDTANNRQGKPGKELGRAKGRGGSGGGTEEKQKTRKEDERRKEVPKGLVDDSAKVDDGEVGLSRVLLEDLLDELGHGQRAIEDTNVLAVSFTESLERLKGEVGGRGLGARRARNLGRRGDDLVATTHALREATLDLRLALIGTFELVEDSELNTRIKKREIEREGQKEREEERRRTAS